MNSFQIWDVILTVSLFRFSDGNTSRWCCLESHSAAVSQLPSQEFWQDKTEKPE